MKRNGYLLTGLVLAAMAAWAQESAPTPAVEVGLNFSTLTTYPGHGAGSFTGSGGSGTFVYNFSKYLSGVADLGGYHNPGDLNYNPTTFTYLFGPRLNLRMSKVNPYVQTLFGGARQWTGFFDTTSGSSTPHNGFAAAFGGGMDVRISDHLRVKPFQLEYLLTRVDNPWSTAAQQNGIRYTAGVVFTLGSK